MSYEEIFNRLKKTFSKADVSNVKEHYAFQFNIIGEGEGIFYIEIKDGKLYIEPYEYYDRDAIFIAPANVFFDIAEGKLNPVKAFSLGKLKVAGSLEKALQIRNLLK